MKTATRYVICMTLARDGEVRESRAYTAREVRSHMKQLAKSCLFSSIKVRKLS